MEKKELRQLCETWTEYLQESTGSIHIRYYLDEYDNMFFQREDCEVLDSSEQSIINDINDTFDDFLRGKLFDWLQAEYIEEVIGIDYDSQKYIWLEVAEILYRMGSPRNEEFCKDKIKGKFWSPFQRVDYLLQAVKE